MKYKKIFVFIASIIAVIIILIICKGIKVNRSNNTQEENVEYKQEYEEMKANSLMYKQDSTLNELKEEYKITGPDDIYQVNVENDGRKVINIKPSVEYKVAFCGMIKSSKPEFYELDDILKKEHPSQNGIWIREVDRERILQYLNNNEFLNSKYEIDNLGFIKVAQEKDKTSIDEQIQKLINSNKQYLLCISSTCYVVDTVTGEIVDNPYNEFEEYQTYEYFCDENKTLLFITENKESKMNNSEIFESIIQLLKNIDD